jgi:hypothetical protein
VRQDADAKIDRGFAAFAAVKSPPAGQEGRSLAMRHLDSFGFSRFASAWLVVVAFFAVAAGCNTRLASSGSPNSGNTGGDLTSCQPGKDLAGAQYDVTKSHFAFGGPPVRDDSNGFVRWVGPDGVVAIETTGGELGVMNGGAAETNLPDWSTDPVALGAHVRDYFLSFGVAGCQMPQTQVLGGSGSVISIARLVDGIPVAESVAYARFNNNEQSTSEGFYWPLVPAAVVDAARALRDRLADPTTAAAYKALLPAADQGDGQVLIHHTNSASTDAFASAATYDVTESGGVLGRGRTASFDATGHDVTTSW